MPRPLFTTGDNVEFEQLSIPDVVLFKPKVHGDDRGFFMEMYRQHDFEKLCGAHQFVQTNFSRSAQGILRGLHYQLNNPQGKLVCVTRGEVFDVCVDLRRSSATYGEWLGVYLSEHNKHSLWIPPGFAHGFYVTSDVADFQYQCTDYYNPADEHCLVWNDPELAINWPLSEAVPNCSAKDLKGLSFSACPKFD